MKNLFRRAVVLALACGLLPLSGCAAHQHAYEQTVIAPTCSSIGYTINVCSCGDRFYSDYRSKSAHAYSDWEQGTVPDLVNAGEEFSYCTLCGDLRVRESKNLSALPKLYFTFGTHGEADSLLFESADSVFTCGASLTADGSAEKQDYSLSLYYKADRSAYNTDLGWGDQSTYRLCGQYSDPLKCRDRAGAAVRNALLREEDRVQGGFPVQLYVDGIYRGVYDLLPDQSWLFRRGGAKNASLVASDETCDFASEPVFSRPGLGEKASGFAFLHCSGESTAWAETRFLEFCEFVKNATDKQFIEHLSDYTDVGVLTDAFLTAEVLCAAHRLETGMIWYTADGTKWLPDFSDLTCSFGITEEGIACWHAYNLPKTNAKGEPVYSGSSLLWKRFVQLMIGTIRTRYTELRAELFTAEALTEMFEAERAKEEAGLLTAESELYPGTPEANGAQALPDFLARRLEALDGLFLAREK